MRNEPFWKFPIFYSFIKAEGSLIFRDAYNKLINTHNKKPIYTQNISSKQ